MTVFSEVTYALLIEKLEKLIRDTDVKNEDPVRVTLKRGVELSSQKLTVIGSLKEKIEQSIQIEQRDNQYKAQWIKALKEANDAIEELRKTEGHAPGHTEQTIKTLRDFINAFFPALQLKHLENYTNQSNDLFKFYKALASFIAIRKYDDCEAVITGASISFGMFTNNPVISPKPRFLKALDELTDKYITRVQNNIAGHNQEDAGFVQRANELVEDHLELLCHKYDAIRTQYAWLMGAFGQVLPEDFIMCIRSAQAEFEDNELEAEDEEQKSQESAL